MKTALQAAAGIATYLLIGAPAASQQSSEPVFGTTVVIPYGLRGEIYFVPPGIAKLPGFSSLDPAGVIYASKLDIPARPFKQGFPGVTKRIEWFAIDYSGRFWIREPGDYRFRLTSDDGSKLYIDGLLVIDNDGIHEPASREGDVVLSRGVHHIRLSYFQGPRFQIALTLEVRTPNGDFRAFSTEEFRPPYNAEDWKADGLDDLKSPSAASGYRRSQQAQEAFMEGAAEIAGNNFRGAANHLERVTAIDPADVRAWSMFGIALYRSGSVEGAREAWRKALSIDPGDVKAAVHLASLELEQGRNQEALRIAKAAIASLDTGNPSLYFCDAVASANLHDPDAAIRSAQTAIRLDMADEAPRARELLQKLLAEKAPR